MPSEYGILSEVKIFVVRHGLTKMNKLGLVNGEADDQLEPEGVKQAQELAKKLPEVKHIFYSPLTRAKETAMIFSEASGFPAKEESALSEVKMGSLAGKSWDEMPNGTVLKQAHRTVRYDYRPTGGESTDDVTQRLTRLFKHLTKNYRSGEVLLVTHGGIIRTMQFMERGQPKYETTTNVKVLQFDLGIIFSQSELNLK